MARRRRFSFWMPPLEHRSIWLFDDWHRGRLTIGGRVLLWGAAASGTMMLGRISLPLSYVFGFCVAALLLAMVLGLPWRPRLKMERQITSYPSAGEVFTYRVRVENVGRRAARQIIVEERALPPDLRPVGEPPILDSLSPGECTTVPIRLRCQRRGAYDLERLQGASCFPTGLFKSGRKLACFDRLLVYPRIMAIGPLVLPRTSNYQLGGIAVASQVGESTEFFGTRDWRRGDRLRDIHWPSTARAGRLIAKEFQEEYFVRLAIALDVEARQYRDEPFLERAISLAAGIADSLARMDHIVDIFAAGQEVYHFQAGRALAHLDNILEILACIESGRRLNVDALGAALLPEARRLSAVIFVLTGWDRRRAELVRLLKSHGVAVRVISVRKHRPPVELDAIEVIESPP